MNRYSIFKCFIVFLGVISLLGYYNQAKAQEQKALVTKPLTIGEIEVLTIEPDRENINVSARVDTGATTSSLDADDIIEFEREGIPWVRFKINATERGKQFEFERKIEKTILVKRHNADSQHRFVVNMWIKIGTLKLQRLFSLTNRDNFKFPALIGRNILFGTAVVDVSQKYVLGSPEKDQ